jgi:OOP family OmpA-OmpF porin
MRNAKMWLWGLLPLAVVWALGNLTTGPLIKADLVARTNESMAKQGQPWAKADISGRDARIVSAAPSPGAKVSAIAAAVDTYGVRIVSGEGEVLPPRNPYVWSVERSANSLRLKGYAPDDATRGQIRAAAARALPGGAITSQLELADGAPKEFSAATAYALEQLSRLAEGDASLSNTTLSISGRAATREGYNAFVAALKTLPHGFTMSSANVIPPRVSPFVFKVERANGALALEGFVPDEATRAQVTAAAARLMPGVAVKSQLELADGAPQGFGAMAVFALEQAARLGSGSATLSDAELSVQGQAANVANYAALIEAPQTLPPGLRLGARAITPATMSPYEWSVEKSDGGITLRGAVPDAARKDANVAAARALGGSVRDEQFIAGGAPANYPAIVEAALGAVAKLETGTAALNGAALQLNGRAARPDVIDEVRKTVQAVVPGATDIITAPQPAPVEPAQPQIPMTQIPVPPDAPPLATDLVAPAPVPAPAKPAPAPVVQAPPPPPVPAQVIVRAPEPVSAPAESCKTRVEKAIDGRRVLFARSRAEIEGASEELVRAVAAALKDCGSIDISIEGHADGDGQAFNNQRLSEARAAAVLDALKATGAGDARLTSKGFGFSQPLVPNDSQENKAKNRRVEMVIR